MESDESGQRALARLRSVPSVTALTLAEGQVILYADHSPLGLYVFLSGSLGEKGGTGRPKEHSAVNEPFLMPPYDELNQVSEVTLTVTKRSRVLFVPRLAIQEDPDVKGCLEAL